MYNSLEHAVLAAWAAMNLPARLSAAATAKVLGFAEHDIQVLMATRKLMPLGSPAPNAPKVFSAMEIIGLAGNREWLDKATKDVSKYWRNKRERRRGPEDSRQAVTGRVMLQAEKLHLDLRQRRN